MQTTTKRLNHDTDDIEDSNDRVDETVAPNEPVVDDKDVFNDDNKSKKVTPDRVMAEGKEVIDDNHLKAKASNYKLVAKNKERTFSVTMYFKPNNKNQRRKEHSNKINHQIQTITKYE